MYKINSITLTLALIILVSLLFNTAGIDWGLPSAERNRLYFSGTEQITKSFERITPEQLKKSMDPDSALHGMDFNPLRSYHPDESNFLKAISNMDPASLDLNPHYFHYGTLYIYAYAALLFVLSLLELVTLKVDLLFYLLDPGEMARIYVAGRAISAVSCTASVYLLYVIGRELYKDENTALAAAAFFAVCPLAVINSHYAAADMLSVFFALLSFLMCLKSMATGRLKWYVLTGAAAGLAGATKYTSGLVIFALPLSCLFTEKRPGFARGLVCGFLASVAAFVLVCPFVITDWREFSSFVIGVNLKAAMREARGNGFLFYLNALWHGMAYVLPLCAAGGAVLGILRKKKDVLFLLSWVVPVFAFFCLARLRHDRFMLLVVPFLCLMAAAFVRALCGKTYGRIVLPAAVFVFAGLVTSGYAGLFCAENTRTEAARWVADNVPKNSLLGVMYPYYQFTTIPLNQERYSLVKLDGDPARLESEKPAYVIITNIHFNYLETRNRISETEHPLVKELMDGTHYRLLKAFSKAPAVLGMTYNQVPAHDYLYLYPEIYVFERNAGT